jgi:hypothetical protein
MPGYLLNMNATGTCAHGGQAQPLAGNPRVKLGGAPALTITTQFAIAGCPNVVGPSPFPCVLASFVAGSTRVKVMGMPLLIADSPSVNAPTGVPTTVINTQLRVKGV